MSIALCVVVGIVVVVVRKVSVLGHVGHVWLRLLEDRFQRHSVHSRLLRRHGLGTILQNFFAATSGTVNYYFNSWAGALVKWLWEETHALKVVGENKLKRGRGWPI